MNRISTGLISAVAGLALSGVALGQDTTISDGGGGTPLTDEQKAALEATMGNDLSSVRVHTGGNARDAAGETGADAYTNQNHIWLGGGSTGSDAGLIAHELTHTLQQQSSATEQAEDEEEDAPAAAAERRRPEGRPRPRQGRRPDQR